ncbi:hypothetical protein C0Q70_20080 [Pomacea canaliculata]|uniref:Sema domain-containing protein n=1 Tax=Pomacea canaliculata TaxID=400727 RepID=A0A2T7NEK0_POMCA|nr:hypothetical protein C0Q70_20080 [Pomacea canaliculata]
MTDLNMRTYQDNTSENGYYRYLTVDAESGYLFVGAMNAIHALNLYNIESSSRRFKQEFNATPLSVYQCKIQGKPEIPDCRNHVRLLVRNSSIPNTFYMCSTGAFHPMAYQLKRRKTPRFQILKEDMENAVGICPYDPADNTTAVLVERGNPGGIPALYAGGVTDFIKADPIILRPDLYHLNRSLENDQGGRYVLKNVWTSFVKARLNCSIPGEYPYYFDEIQDVYLIGETFYGLFTTNINGLTASAICAFTLSDMNKAFWGPFKGQETKKSNWLPIPESEVPDPRPGNCTVADTQQLSAQAVNFISRSELLMDQAVSHQYSRPLFYQGNCLLQKLAVVSNVSTNGDLVFYAASNTGLVYKIFSWPSKTPGEAPKSYVSTTYIPFDDVRPVWSMILQGQTLFLGTDQSVAQMSVVTCDAYRKVDLCIYDPYCGWDVNTNEYLLHFADIDIDTYGLDKAIQLRVGDLYKYEKVSKILGSSVTLKIDYKLHVPGLVSWKHNGTSLRTIAISWHKLAPSLLLNSVRLTREQKCSTCCQDSQISNVVPSIGEE